MADERQPPTQHAASRIERILARIGLATLACLALAAVIGVDVLLTGTIEPEADPGGQAFTLVTEEGDELGQGTDRKLRLMMSPSTVYRNRPAPEAGINAFGLRGPEIDPIKTRPRVLVVGGSAVFGPKPYSFVNRLGQLRPEFEFLNAGVIGYLTRQEVALVAFDLLQLDPDLIIAFDGWNDLYDRYWWNRFGEPSVGHRDVNVTWNFLENRLRRYRRIEWEPGFAAWEAWRSVVRGSTLLSALDRAFAGDTPPRDITVDAATLDEVAAKYVDNMVLLRDLAASRGAGLIVVIQPELGQLLAPQDLEYARTDWILERRLDEAEWAGYWDDFPPLYAVFRERIAADLKQRGIHVLDASDRLASARAGFEAFIDPVHLSRAGHDKVAAWLSAEIPPARFLSDLSQPPAAE